MVDFCANSGEWREAIKEEKEVENSIRRPRRNSPCNVQKFEVARPCANKRKTPNRRFWTERPDET